MVSLKDALALNLPTTGGTQVLPGEDIHTYIQEFEELYHELGGLEHDDEADGDEQGHEEADGDDSSYDEREREPAHDF